MGVASRTLLIVCPFVPAKPLWQCSKLLKEVARGDRELARAATSKRWGQYVKNVKQSSRRKSGSLLGIKSCSSLVELVFEVGKFSCISACTCEHLAVTRLTFLLLISALAVKSEKPVFGIQSLGMCFHA